MRPPNLLSAVGRLVPGVVLAVALAGAGPARAQSNLQAEVAEAAKDLKQLLEQRQEGAIAVGAFTGPSHLAASAGPGIAKVLADELKKLNVRVERRAKYEVKGDYTDIVDADSKQLAAKLTFRVLDRSGKQITELERAVFGDATLPSLFGLTADLPADSDADVRRKKLEEAIDHPHPQLKDTRLAAAPGSPYAVEVLVGPPGGPFTARAPEEKDGLAFVEIKRGEVYRVRLHNDSPHDAAITLTIDGLSVFAFSEVKDKAGNPKYNNFFIPRGASTIDGWYINNSQADEFLVTELPKSAVAEKGLRDADSIGTITVTFAAAWPKDAPPPPDEPKAPPPFSRSGDATGRGQRVGVNLVETERHLGVVRAAVSVRYAK
jgi:hypothetical protein